MTIDFKSLKESPSACKHVLGIEDDLEQQLILERILKSAHPGIIVDWVFNAESAIEQFEQLPYDLVIADVSLGRGETGIEFWEQAKTIRGDVPFLFVSGMGYNDFLKGIASNEPSPAFLNKPVLPGEASQIIRYFLNLDR